MVVCDDESIPEHSGGGRPLSKRPNGPGTALANFLIDRLPATGLTNEGISEKLGYRRPNIVSMWKTAKTKVTLDAIWPLAELLDVDQAYMLALYFEQYTGDNGGGVNRFEEIVAMMGRVTTPDEWEIIQTVRAARNFHSVPLQATQKAALEALFRSEHEFGVGPLKEIEMKFASYGDRRAFARRGQGRDKSVSEIEAVKSTGNESS